MRLPECKRTGLYSHYQLATGYASIRGQVHKAKVREGQSAMCGIHESRGCGHLIRLGHVKSTHSLSVQNVPAKHHG